jgi:hypothetical protein
VTISVDGGDNHDDMDGGASQMLSLNSIQEYTISSQRFNSNYGGASGAIINTITNSGTNTNKASLFFLLQNNAFSKQPFAQKQAGINEPSSSRIHFGGTLGGAIKKDKTHYFFSLERLQQTSQLVTNSYGIFPGEDGPHDVELRNTQLFAKVTTILNSRQNLMIRYAYQNFSDIYDAHSFYTPDAWATSKNTAHSILAGHTFIYRPNMLNEFIFQYSRFDNEVLANSDSATILFPNSVVSGRNPEAPQQSKQTKIQFKDEISYNRMLAKHSHTFKAGFNFIFEPKLEKAFMGGIDIPQYSMLGNSIDSPVTNILIMNGDLSASNKNNQFSFYIHDDWRISDKISMNLGFRYDLVTGFELDQASSVIFQALAAQSTYNEEYLQIFKQSAVGKNDTNNFQPRIGFTYDVRGNGLVIIRGGYGRYYDFPYLNSNYLYPRAALGEYYIQYFNYNENGITNPDGSFWKIGEPLPPNQVPDPLYVVRDIGSTEFKVPYTDQVSGGFEYQLKKDLSMEADYVYSKGNDQFIAFRFNGLDQQKNSRRFPSLSPYARIWYAAGFYTYKGIHLTVHKQFSHNFELYGTYNISRVTGNVLAGSDNWNTGSPIICSDCLIDFKDPQATVQVGPLNTDALHRISIAGIFQLPYDIQLSVFGRLHSAFPYNNFSVVDLNGDGFNYDIPDSYTHVNENRGEWFNQIDIKVTRDFRFKKYRIEAMLEIFNIFNGKNATGFIGNSDSANYGEPTIWAGDPGYFEQMLAQLGVRVEF